MKKLILAVSVILVMMSSTVWAQCNNECNQTVGAIEYTTGIHDFNYQTNAGYCIKGENPGGVVLKVCDSCTNPSEILESETYKVMLKSNTKGVYFSDGDITTRSYALADTLCSTPEVATPTDYAMSRLSDNTVTVMDDAEYLFKTAHPYFMVALPTMYYDSTELDPSATVNITVAILQGNTVCPICESSIVCQCDFDIAKVGCAKCCNLLSYVITNDTNWWSGIALTNTSDNTVYVTAVFVADDTNQYTTELTLAPHQVYTEMADLMFDGIEAKNGYIKFTSTESIEAICILGSAEGVYGYVGRNSCGCGK